MVGINREQEVGLHVAHKVHAGYGAPPQLALNADVHLHRTRRLIIRREELVAGGIGAVSQVFTQEVWIHGDTGRGSGALEQRL